MRKTKMFLYDFLTNRKIKRTSLVIVLFFAIATVIHNKYPEWVISGPAIPSIGLSMVFLTTLYSLFSYCTMDRIRAYLMLPCKKSEVFFSFVFTQFFSLLLERMSFVMIVVVFFTSKPVMIISNLLMGALVTVILDVVILVSLNRKRWLFTCVALALIAMLYGVLIWELSPVLTVSALLAMTVLSIVLLACFEAKHLAVNRSRNKHGEFLQYANYFFIVLLREKAALINTAAIFIFAGVFAFTSQGNPVMLSIVWGIMAVNTPISTMFSGDKALMRQERMLPKHSRLMQGLYGIFLTTYFAIANCYVTLLFFLFGQFSLSVIITGTILVGVEVSAILFLERRFPICSWQTKQEVWRNPRKYILPIIVFAVTAIPFLLGGA